MLIAAKMKLVVAMVVIVGIVMGVGGILVGQEFGKGVAARGPTTTMSGVAEVAGTRAGSEGSVISGTVLDAGGKPVASAFVSITMNGGRLDPSVFASTRSDARGIFSFPFAMPSLESEGRQPEIFADLPGVGFSKPGKIGKEGAVVLRLVAASEAQIPLIRPDGTPASQLSAFPTFIIFDPVSNEIMGSSMRLPAEISKRWAVTTDGKGVATFNGVPQHSRLRLDVEDESLAQIDLRSEVTLGADAVIHAEAIQLFTASAITGIVKYSDTGKPAVDIHLHTGTIITGGSERMTIASTTTDEEGRFRLGRLRESKYAVYCDTDNLMEYTAFAPIVTTIEGRTTTTYIQLIHGGMVAGMVRSKLSGKGIGGLDVGLYEAARRKIGGEVLMHVTDKEGRFSFRVPPGEQYVYVAVMQVEGYVVPHTDAGRMEPVVEIPGPMVREGETTEYNIDLEPEVGPSISGRVVDAQGKGAAHAIVSYRESDEKMELSRAVTADGEGRFVIKGFKKGTELRAVAGAGSAEATLRAVTVNAAEDEVVLQLSATGTFSLVVKTAGADGKVVPNTTVTLSWMGGRYGLLGMPSTVNGDGTIRYEGLYRDYSYDVYVKAPGYGTTMTRTKAADDGAAEKEVRLTLKPADTPTRGTVRDEAGKGVAGVEVAVSDLLGEASKKTDEYGHFEFLIPRGMKVLISVQGVGKATPPAMSVTAGDVGVDFVVKGVGK